MTRWKAAAIHFALSVLVVGSVALGLIFLWYGPDLFALTGGLKLLTILGVCDVVIGPLLTLIVYKQGKASLKFDLAVIALLQVAFLAYGLNVMRQARPVFLVGVLDRFELVFAGELSDQDLAKGTAPEYRTRSLTGPRLVGGIVARDSRETLDLAMSGFAGKDVQLMPDRYTDYSNVAHDLGLKARPVSELIGFSRPDAARRLERAVKATGRDEHTIGFLPIVSRRGRATMLVELGTGDVLRRVGVEPWPDLADK